jgi:hypothetical protein
MHDPNVFGHATCGSPSIVHTTDHFDNPSATRAILLGTLITGAPLSSVGLTGTCFTTSVPLC